MAGTGESRISFLADRQCSSTSPSVRFFVVIGRRYVGSVSFSISARLVRCARRIWALYGSPSCRLVHGSLPDHEKIRMYRQGIISNSVIREQAIGTNQGVSEGA